MQKLHCFLGAPKDVSSSSKTVKSLLEFECFTVTNFMSFFLIPTGLSYRNESVTWDEANNMCRNRSATLMFSGFYDSYRKNSIYDQLLPKTSRVIFWTNLCLQDQDQCKYGETNVVRSSAPLITITHFQFKNKKAKHAIQVLCKIRKKCKMLLKIICCIYII